MYPTLPGRSPEIGCVSAILLSEINNIIMNGFFLYSAIISAASSLGAGSKVIVAIPGFLCRREMVFLGFLLEERIFFPRISPDDFSPYLID